MEHGTGAIFPTHFSPLVKKLSGRNVSVQVEYLKYGDGTEPFWKKIGDERAKLFLMFLKNEKERQKSEHLKKIAYRSVRNVNPQFPLPHTNNNDNDKKPSHLPSSIGNFRSSLSQSRSFLFEHPLCVTFFVFF